MKKLIILLLSPFLLFVGAKAQITLSGTVVDDLSQPLPGANVLLLSIKDSSLVKGGITDAEGKFWITKMGSGSYLLSISSIGFKTKSAPIKLFNDLDLGILMMETEATALEEVMITADRPLFEQKLDRLVVNVQNRITTAGGSALDVLERSPGVLVNKGTNSLSLNGKEGVLVMINGKVSRLSMSAIMQLLSATNAENIEKIELITNPPAKYEAGSNGGIINIQLVQRTDLGTNGSVGISAGYGQGEKAGTSVNLNHRKDKLNLYGDFSFSRNHWFPSWYNSRKLKDGSETVVIKSTTYREPINTIYNGRVGLDYQLSEKTLMGGFLAGFSNLWDMEATIVGSTESSIHPPSFVDIELIEKGRFKNLMGNFNLSQKIGQKTDLNLDLDYLYYQDRNETTYENFFSKKRASPTSDGFRKTNKDTPIKIWVASVDLTHHFRPELKLEAGLKGTTSSLKNDVIVRDLYSGELVVDDSFSESSELEEEILGAYSSLSYSINDKTNINLGLRYEYAETILDLQNKNNVVDLKNSNLFPTFFISRKLAQETSLQFSYGRRITRPSFSDLAPFFIFLDPSTFFYGNTSLTPSISDNLKFGLNYKQYLLTLEHTHEDNAIQYYQPVMVEGTSQQAFTTLNLPYKNTTSLILSIPIDFTSWWSMNLNILGVSTLLETLENEKQNQNYYRLNITKNFQLPSDFSLEFSGFYQSASLVGISIMGAYQNVNMGVQKKFRNESKLRFSFNNIFGFTMNYYTDDQKGYSNHAQFRFERRIFNLAFTYPFGNESLKKKRNRFTSSDDIRNRIK